MLLSEYQNIIHLRTYARWDYALKQRETWDMTVGRYIKFMQSHAKENFGFEDPGLFANLTSSIYGLNVMPSMRALMTAGPALDRDHISGFNCSYIPMDNVRAFDEIVYILMCGTGVGFSVERQAISKLPEVPENLYPTDSVIRVRDSKLGWAKAYKQLIALLYSGEVPKWDVSAVRPAGAPLKTFGGRASGPQPLVDLFEFTIRIFDHAKGRKLESLEVHDIVCKIGEVVVSGGVRRSALISLSNLSDQRMRDAKSGQWWNTDPHRRLANNSAAYTEKPEVGHFMQEWLSLYSSKSGERGIFNRQATIDQCERHGRVVQTKSGPINFGTNPCGEIILRPMEFCNLSEVVARSEDTKDDLIDKVRLATIIGTLQSTLTNYRYLRSDWQTNSEEERLLGVSITGIMDCPLINRPTELTAVLLQELQEVAVETNKDLASKLGIERSAAITCVKPSGTVSQLVNSSSGIHPRHNPFYIRRIRIDEKDPLCLFMQSQGFPNERDQMGPHQFVFDFPIMSPQGALTRDQVSSIDMLRLWKLYRDQWCQHNPSVTINVREKEWPSVGAWVWDNFDQVGGISFLPYADHSYKQAPYEDITQEQFNDFVTRMPNEVDWSKLAEFEQEDYTTGSQELACVGGQCDL